MVYSRSKAVKRKGTAPHQLPDIYERVVPPIEERIRVGNLKQETEGVLIAAPTIFQNRYRNWPHLSRDQKIQRYAEDLNKLMQERDGFVYRALLVLAKRLVFGGDHGQGEAVVLLCHCAPKECHGDLLRIKILELAAELQEQKK